MRPGSGSRWGGGFSWPTVNICWQNWPLGNFFLFLDLDLDSWTIDPSELLKKWMPCILKILNFSIHNLYFKLYRFSRNLSKSYLIPYVCCPNKIRLYLLIVNKSLSVVSLILKCNINILIHFYEYIVYFFFYKVLIFSLVSSLINGLLTHSSPTLDPPLVGLRIRTDSLYRINRAKIV
jgi:hypothetical protein